MSETPPSTALVPGHQFLIFFQSGYDEPPEGGILATCGESICVEDGTGLRLPLTEVAGGWIYRTEYARYMLNADGSGHMVADSGYEIDVTWMTEPF